MDIISELNPHSFSTCFQGDGKSRNIVSVSLVQDRLRYSLKSIKIENLIDREIESVYQSGVQTTMATRFLTREGTGKVKVVRDRMLVWQEKET